MRITNARGTALAASAIAGFALIGSSTAVAGPAIGQFEIKSLRSTPGQFEFQSQNAYDLGIPRRQTRTMGGEFEADHNSLPRQRNALEIEYGITTFLKARLGVEYERERREDPTSVHDAQGFEDLKLDEYEAEVIWVLVPRRGDGFGLGVVVEYEHPAESGGTKKLNYGPLFEYQNGPWRLTLNPMLSQFLGGDRNEAGKKDEKIDFGYSARILNRWSESFAVALEAYGSIERIGGRGGRSDDAQLFGDFDQHRIGPVLYWSWIPGGEGSHTHPFGRDRDSEVTLGVGTLFGLNDDTPTASLKLSMEVEF